MENLSRRNMMRLAVAGGMLAAGTTAPAWARSAHALGDEPLLHLDPDASMMWKLGSHMAMDNVRDNTKAILGKGTWKFTKALQPDKDDEYLKGLAKQGKWLDLVEYFAPYLGPLVGGELKHTMESYRAAFAVPELTVPGVADTFESDTTFAENFVAGPDPTQLVRLKAVPEKFPLTQKHLQSVPKLASDNLETAMAAGRIYWIDYKITAELTNGVYSAKIPKFSYSPMIAFCVPKGGGALVPFAIQCGQQPTGRQIYTPADGYSWKIARNCVQVAHNTVYEVLTHLGHTHLLADALLQAAITTLPAAHPVAKLFAHHFAGTPFINTLGLPVLSQPGGWLEGACGASLKSILPWLDKHIASYSFRDNFLTTRLKKSGTNDTAALPHFPYRDDGLLLWKAATVWANGFVDAYFKTDESVAKDASLQKFASAVHAGGKVKDFTRSAGKIADREELAEILTMIMWTTGPQHAAVNFAQLEWLSFAPANPLAGFTPEPKGTGHTRQDWLDNFPPFDVAMLHVDSTVLLTAVHDTIFGDYEEKFEKTPAEKAAKAFQNELIDIQQTITSRNKKREMPYLYLLPEDIPNSINV